MLLPFQEVVMLQQLVLPTKKHKCDQLVNHLQKIFIK